MFFLVGDILMLVLVTSMAVFMFFAFDEIILKGYFATKLRKRFDVESLK
jgi:hypothetical protein